MSHLIPHEQTKSNSLRFSTLEAIFSKDLSKNKKTSKINSLLISRIYLRPEPGTKTIVLMTNICI